MYAESSLTNVKVWCVKQSGDEQVWTNKGTTYHWNRGRPTSNGVINGVVRKLSGIDSHGCQIWKLAGSVKIDANGKILRFTGIPRKIQKTFEPVTIPHFTNTKNPIDFPQEA